MTNLSLFVRRLSFTMLPTFHFYILYRKQASYVLFLDTRIRLLPTVFIYIHLPHNFDEDQATKLQFRLQL